MLENNIRDKISPDTSVGARNRPERDEFSQYFVSEIGPFENDFWRLCFSMDLFGQECYFPTFRALQDGFFRFFFETIQNDTCSFKVPFQILIS